MPELRLHAAAKRLRGFPDAPRTVSALLLVLIALDAGWAARRLLAPQAPIPLAVAAMPAVRAGGVDVTSIVANHLFGVAPDLVSAPGAIAPDSHADWILSGTMATGDSKRDGLAILSNQAQPPALYRVGEPVGDGVKLVEVFADRVVLQRSGAAETVWMTKKSTTGLVRGALLSRAATEDDELRRFGHSTKWPLQGARDREHPLEPPSSPLIFKLRVASVVIDEHLLGYRVLMGSTLLQGLPSGAIVTQINGVDLVDGQAAARMFESLAAGGTAAFTIRDGDGDAQKQISVDASAVPGALALRKRAPSG